MWADHSLYVVSEIRVHAMTVSSARGKANRIEKWSIADEDLIPTEYSYAVPKRTIDHDQKSAI
jgi:hypothetical protein